MTNTNRWVIGAILAFVGLVITGCILSFFSFFTFGCYGQGNDIATILLYIAAAVSFLSPILPIVMLIRKSASRSVAIAAGISFIATFGCIGVYVFFTMVMCAKLGYGV